MNKIQTFILKALGYEQRNMSPALTAMMLGETPTASGVNVSETNAMRTSAVYACVRVLAESMASLPLITYRQTKAGKERATNHRLYPILHDQPNSEMTAFEFRVAMMTSLLLWGNAYAEIETNARGDVLALWPLLPGMMEVMRTRPASAGERGKLYYHYQLPDGSYQDLVPYQIMHIRGLSFNGVVGLSPIQMAREAIGLSMATQEFGARFFGNGARPGVYLEHPGKLGDKAYERLLGSWNATHQGLANSHRATILEEGMKLETVGVPPEDAQFLETRNFQVEEIARIYRVPLHLIGDLRRATFSNIEWMSMNYVIYSLVPWATCWEQAITRDLIGPLERSTIYAKFLMSGLLRGDQAARYNAYAVGRQWGWLSVNDVRRLEDMNEIPEGDVYLEPLNMKDAADESPAPQASASGAPAEEPAANSARDWSMLYEDAVARIRKRAARDIDARRAKLTPEKLSEWWAEYRAGDLDAYAQLVLGPLATTIGRDARQWAADVIRSLDSGAPRDAAGAQPVITINVPPQPAPVVHVDAPVVHVAAPPAPYVVVDVAAPPAPSVTINSPRIAEENQTIERDARGNITSTTTTVTYEGGNQ
jgi:HK97 family phage portal protein